MVKYEVHILRSNVTKNFKTQLNKYFMRKPWEASETNSIYSIFSLSFIIYSLVTLFYWPELFYYCHYWVVLKIHNHNRTYCTKPRNYWKVKKNSVEKSRYDGFLKNHPYLERWGRVAIKGLDRDCECGRLTQLKQNF